MENEKPSYDLIPLFESFKRDHGYTLRADYYGFELRDAKGEMVYQDGEYRGIPVNEPDAVYVFQLRVVKLTRWAILNAPTPEVFEFGRYIRDLFIPTVH